MESDGSSAEKAVVINATSTVLGIWEEYAYIERVCGKKAVDYIVRKQMQISEIGREYDVYEIRMRDGSMRSLWFDITSFFGKL